MPNNISDYPVAQLVAYEAVSFIAMYLVIRLRVNYHILLVAAATGPAICIILASYSGCDRFAAVAYFIASMALMGGFYSGMKVHIT